MIVQGRQGGFVMEFLYALIPEAKMKAQWGFVKRVYQTVDAVCFDDIRKAVFGMRSE